MVTKIYLPAMRGPIVNGIRLGVGVAIIGTLLAETKLSNKGLGYLIIQAYSLFDMPKLSPSSRPPKCTSFVATTGSPRSAAARRRIPFSTGCSTRP
jgi:hypothetical protein